MAGLFTPKDAAMNIVIVTINQDHAAIASWLAAQDFSGCTAHWQIEPQPMVAEQVLDALVEQWQRTPADVVLFLRARLAMNCRPGWLAFTWCKHLPGDFVRYSNRKRAQIPLGKCVDGDAANRQTPAMPFAGTSGGSR